MRIGVGEIGLLIVLAILMFGAKRLPEIGRAVGDAMREFKSALNGERKKDESKDDMDGG
ncbi:MAG: twin-arginine translocase TatA/TatE family subunit [Synergistaceae bacterium]|jgi:sec-independent protein translocase protein TatA|nr:twin-arginine translocase TatA/TatE family subunit [Synergistaceae bacterium]